MITLVGSVLVASLLGSLHCAGMCGGFVCFYAGQRHERRLLPHFAYNGGRLVSYALLGALAGALGAGLDRLGALAGVTRGATLVAGALMVVWGVVTLLRLSGARLPRLARSGFTPAPLAGALRAVREQPPALRALVLGLVTTLIPCGWLYAFAATAASTGSPWRGALVMAVFWTGTLPVMTGLGLIAQHAFGPLRARLPAMTAGVLVVLGLLTLGGRFHAAPTSVLHAKSCCHVGP